MHHPATDARTRPRWWWYLPVALLIATACRQIVLTRTAHLTPWSGGGFGMFSTTDGWGHRSLQAFAVRPDVRRALAIPEGFAGIVDRIRAYPADARRIRTLARALADVPTGDAGPLEAIEVQVWATVHDPATLAPAPSLLRVVRVPVGER